MEDVAPLVWYTDGEISIASHATDTARLPGVLDFIPLMRISYNYTPSRAFGLLGYQMFAFLFNWTDANWVSPSRRAW